MHSRHADTPKITVDPSNFALDIDAQRLILLDPFATWRRHLDHDHLGYGEPAFGQKFTESLDPALDPLRVIKPIDAEDDGLRLPQLCSDFGRALTDRRAGREFLDLGH